jgi:cytochrome c oxidase cbb3-type subunit 3/ubiquinol-cytochrome c reductase cytochrome c subunit
MRRLPPILPAIILPAVFLVSCGDRVEHFTMPDQIADFKALYESNCSGCHGNEGRHGAARPLNDPVFLAVIDKRTIQDTIAQGRPGTAMPVFAKSAGGSLTDQQIAILTNQMESRWSRPQDFRGVDLPPYRGDLGDPKTGEQIFRRECAGCHREKGPGGSLTEPSFLTLVSDQSLRTSIIAGRSDRGMPDWRQHSHPLTNDEISGVVAWIASHRPMPINLTRRGPQ